MRILLKKKNKYNARKVTVDGEVFDSQKEANRWRELKLMEKAGEIYDLKRQVAFCLIMAQKGGIRDEKAVSYVADFVYMKRGRKETHRFFKVKDDFDTENGEEVDVEYMFRDFQKYNVRLQSMCRMGSFIRREVDCGIKVIEDVKSPATRTAEYIIKRKLMKQQGHEITEV